MDKQEKWKRVADIWKKYFREDLNQTMRPGYLLDYAEERGVDLASASEEVVYQLVNQAKIDALMRQAGIQDAD